MQNLAQDKSDSKTSLLNQLISIDKNKLWTKRKHLLDTKDLSKEEVEVLLAAASICKRLRLVEEEPLNLLRNKVITTLFYENSTRTRSSFELAAKSLGATFINLDTDKSSVSKGETIHDTANTLVSMGANCIIQRHKSSGSAHILSQNLSDQVHVVNAGDGWNAHPTQALLDLFSMLEHCSSIQGKKIAIIGDIIHSRVARSDIWLLQTFGADIHVAAPPTLLPKGLNELGVKVHLDVNDAIADADFIITLRMQLERQKQGLIPSLGEYKRLYRLDHERLKLAKASVKVLHPGPVNRDIEITDKLASDEKYSLIETQVSNGIAVRMAVLYLLLKADV